MTERGTDFEDRLLALAERQTKVLEMINNLLWWMLGLALLGGILIAASAF